MPPPPIRGIYRTDLRARAAYAEAAGIYRILPQAVCRPSGEDDLREVVRWAGANRLPLIARGAGSAMGGGNVGDGIVLDLTHLNRRLEIDPIRRLAITGASVTLADLNRAAVTHGLRLPPDPSSAAWATLGGMVSTNAAGARSVRYGSVRPWVERLTLITADGETQVLERGKAATEPGVSAALERFRRDAAPAINAAAQPIRARFPRTRKNSSGYALDAYLDSGDELDLLIGAEGTLGFITEITWRLDPVPPCRAGLRLALGSLEDLAPAVSALREVEPSAIELLDRSFLDLVGSDRVAGAGLSFRGAAAVLLVEVEREDERSLRDALELATKRARSLATSVDTAFSPAAAERLWAIRHGASPILAALPDRQRSLQVIEDACVPVAQMGRYIEAVRQAAADAGIPIVMFGHAGDGHIHVNLLPDVRRAGWEQAVSQLMEQVTETVVQLGGTLSGEHGDGRLRAPILDRVYGKEITGLFRALKQSFDPVGILNPGVIVPDGSPAIGRLKAGAGAVSLPEDVERGLREIERTGGYARDRLELAGESVTLSEAKGP